MTGGVTAGIGMRVRMMAFGNGIDMEQPMEPPCVLGGMSEDRCKNGEQNSREEIGDPTRHIGTVSRGRGEARGFWVAGAGKGWNGGPKRLS